MRRVLRISVVLSASMIMLTACIIIPVPPYGAGRITYAQIKGIQPGKSTRSDVLRVLGLPAHRLMDDRYFTYEWRQVNAWVAVPGGGGELAGPRTLAIEFTTQGVVVRIVTLTEEFSGKQLNDWILQSNAADIPKDH